MTPQDKVDELIDKFTEKIYHLHQYPLCVEAAKECALVAVDEIIKNQKKITKNINRNLSIANIQIEDTSNYWNEVKQEIEKL